MPNSKGCNGFTGGEFTTFYDQRGLGFSGFILTHVG